jgi:UDP-N-acetylglucosamine 1-carboxyvinyltransferase
MKKIIINGQNKLNGTIRISGAKNAAVAIIPAAILTETEATICNVPEISDIESLEEILKFLNVEVKRATETIVINTKKMENKVIPEEISSKLRASYYFMGALLAKYKKVEMYFPGGCSIGARPIDQTLKGFKALGASVLEDGDKYTITAEELKGGYVYLDMPSVGATINTILVAVKATGTTIIENAAKEPEIVNVATFLNNMGAKIRGAGTSQIKIVGVDKLHKCMHEVIPDRIEAGTYIIAGALAGDKLKISNIIPEHVESLTSKLI